jgi:Tfp pilus assembly protein PilW
MRNSQAGVSLMELLVTIFLVSLAMAAMVTAFVSQNQISIVQDHRVALHEDLRMAMEVVTETLRRAKYGVPTSNLSLWINWVAGFNTNPLVTNANPDTIAVASCTAEPVATLAADTADPTAPGVTETTLTLDSTDLLHNGNVVRIGDSSEYARVTVDNTTTLTIDTDPQVAGNQEITRRYLSGTPLCRVDVTTFSVDSNKVLWLNQNDGSAAEPIASGMSDLQITTVTAGKQYQVTLTAAKVMPGGSTYQQNLTSDITLKN